MGSPSGPALLRPSGNSFFFSLFSLFSFSPFSSLLPLLFFFQQEEEKIESNSDVSEVEGQVKLWEWNHQAGLQREKIKVRETPGWETQSERFTLPEDLAGLACPVVLLAAEFWETPLMLKVVLLICVASSFYFFQSSHLKSIILGGNCFCFLAI